MHSISNTLLFPTSNKACVPHLGIPSMPAQVADACVLLYWGVLSSVGGQYGSCLMVSILNTLNRDKLAAILQTTFSNTFSSMKKCEFRLEFDWSLSLRIQLTISQTMIWTNNGLFCYWCIYEALGLGELTLCGLHIKHLGQHWFR